MRIKKLKKGFENLTIGKARLIAHLIGDGSVFISNHDYNLKYEVNDSESLNRVYRDIIEIYGLRPSKLWNKSGKTMKSLPLVRLRYKLAYQDITRYATYGSKNWKINKQIMNAPNQIKIAFLQALCDDEATVVKYGIKLYSINLHGSIQIKTMIEGLGFTDLKIQPGYGCKRNVYAIIIKDLERFYNTIGFTLTRKQTKLKKFIKERY